MATARSLLPSSMLIIATGWSPQRFSPPYRLSQRNRSNCYDRVQSSLLAGRGESVAPPKLCSMTVGLHSGSIGWLLSHLPARETYNHVSLRKESSHEQRGKHFFNPVTKEDGAGRV